VYEIVMTFGNHVGKTVVTVHPDPREEQPTGNPFAQREQLQAELDTTVVRLNEAWTDLQQAGKSLTRIEGLLKDAPKAVKDSLTADIKDLKKAIAKIEEIYTDKEGLKGIQRNPTNLQAKMFTAGRYIGQVESKPTQMATVALEQFQSGAADFIKDVEGFMMENFAAFRKEVDAAEISLFGKL
jgi:septal ring factor EnvC (AmiA/AmiB activator)